MPLLKAETKVLPKTSLSDRYLGQDALQVTISLGNCLGDREDD